MSLNDSFIKTWITTANGRESIKPNGPKMKVNPNCDINVKPGSKFAFFFIIDGIII